MKDDPFGVEFAEVDLADEALAAVGVAVTTDPVPYRLDYRLETAAGFVTARLHVVTRGQAWRRRLDLCDLGLSPLTNTMPVLRHGLLSGGGPVELLMAWVSVPDLGVHASGQRYTFIRADDERSLIRFEAPDGTFAADIVFDAGGLVVDYPGIGRRL